MVSLCAKKKNGKKKKLEKKKNFRLTSGQERVDVRRRHVHVTRQRRAPHRQVDRVPRGDVVLLEQDVHVLEERDGSGAMHDKARARADHVEVGGAEAAVGAADVALDCPELGAELGAEGAAFRGGGGGDGFLKTGAAKIFARGRGGRSRGRERHRNSVALSLALALARGG